MKTETHRTLQTKKIVELKVPRSDNELNQTPTYQEFDVPYETGMTVLSAFVCNTLGDFRIGC